MTQIDLLIIGGSGFVGSTLLQLALKKKLSVAYTYLSHKLVLESTSYRVDIGRDNNLEKCIQETQPKVIVYAAVSQSWADEKLQMDISVAGVDKVVATLQKQKFSTLLVYVSTNSIFSGVDGPYKETSYPDPELRLDKYRLYGINRAMGEKLSMKNWQNTIIVRTANVEGRAINGSINPRLLRELEELRKVETIKRFCNRIISPTLVDNLAQAILEIIGPYFSYRGILHVAGCEQISNFEYSKKIRGLLGFNKLQIEPCLFENSYQAAGSINNISLDVSFTQKLLRTRLLNVSEILNSIFLS